MTADLNPQYVTYLYTVPNGSDSNPQYTTYAQTVPRRPDLTEQDHNETYLKRMVKTLFSHDCSPSDSSDWMLFHANKKIVNISLKRIWIGEAAVCGIDMKGTATIMMPEKDPILLERIIKIIQTPTYTTMVGTFPIVDIKDIKVWDPSCIKKNI